MSSGNDFADLDEQSQEVTFYFENRTTSYPVAYFQHIIAGESVEPLPADVLSVIIRDWLEWLNAEV
jgi:hypothetical protein